jgi:hypothetical protein
MDKNNFDVFYKTLVCVVLIFHILLAIPFFYFLFDFIWVIFLHYYYVFFKEKVFSGTGVKNNIQL